MGPAKRLTLRRFLDPSKHAHAVRAYYAPGRKLEYHTHDFAEVMWVEGGSGRHILNGKSTGFEAGMVFLLGPTDSHSIAAAWAGSLVLTNVAFAADLLPKAEVAAAGGPGPLLVSAHAVAELGTVFGRVESGAERRTAVLRFIYEVLDLVERERSRESRHEALPGWLAQALWCLESDLGEVADGADALVRRCGRSRDHVNRVLSRCTGESLSDTICRLRLDHATRLLSTTNQSVTDIALDTGFSNLSYFYRRFKDRFGESPRAYQNRALYAARG